MRSPLEGQRLELFAVRGLSVVGRVTVVLAVVPVTMLVVTAARASGRAPSPVIRSANLSPASDSSGALVAVIAAPRLNTRAIERRIARTIHARNGIKVRVECPRRVPARVGYRFTCFAVLAVGKYPVDVVETKVSHGTMQVDYASGAPLKTLDSRTIERAIETAIRRERGLLARVTCPAPILQKAGLAFICMARFAGGKTYFKVTETDSSGHVNFVGE